MQLRTYICAPHIGNQRAWKGGTASSVLLHSSVWRNFFVPESAAPSSKSFLLISIAAMDPVGLLLGVLGVVVPAYQAVEFLAHRISAAKNFPRKLRSLHAQVSLQKKLFDNECILLFSSEFDESLIREMLHSASHPKWSDLAFQAKLKEHLGEFFDQSTVPFTIITETVKELDATLDRLIMKKGGGVSGETTDYT
jgi:hypothetical protein